MYTAVGKYVIGFQLVSIHELIFCCNDQPISPNTLDAVTPLAVTANATADIEFTTNSPGALTFTSSDTSKATVDDEGKVTGVAEGTATITIAQAAFNTFPAATKTVTVNVAASNG
ncbi:MAG: Ig-like domain-containing protein [Bacteroidaceae bacterium]|nr:Ig-like domain-containing protein [Bacteroidaceae bacterium]